MAVGAGIRIPLKGANKLNLNELELERIEEENDLQLFQIRVAENVLRIENRLEILFNQYDLIQKQLSESQANFALERLNLSVQKSPLLLLQIRENVIARQKSLLDIEYDIFRNYLNFLDLKGKISELPLRNYLINHG